MSHPSVPTGNSLPLSRDQGEAGQAEWMPATDAPPRPRARIEAMPPAATRAGGRGRLVGDESRGEFLFSIGELSYRVSIGPTDHRSSLLPIDVRVGEGDWCSICSGAGMLLHLPGGNILSPTEAAPLLKLEELRVAVRGKTLTLRYAEEFEGVRLRRTCQIRLVGQSLVMQLSAPAAPPDSRTTPAAPPAAEAARASGRSRSRRRRGGSTAAAATPESPVQGRVAYCGFSFGRIGGDTARAITLPSTIDPVFLLENGSFASAYIDRFLSAANACPRGGILYRPDHLGAIGSIEETLYVTAADDPLDALPLLEVPPSPYREELARRVVLDVWSEAPFATDRESFARLRRYGLADLMLHYHTWQQFGAGERLPVHYPANPERGGNEEFRQLILEVREHGWLVALREDYSAIGRKSPFWDERVVARTADGSFRPGLPVLGPEAGWTGTEDGSTDALGTVEANGPASIPPDATFAVAAERMLSFARLESTKIERNYSPGAASVGGGASFNPEDRLHLIDLGPHNPASRTLSASIRHCQRLFQYLADLHRGPVLAVGGEGEERFDTYYAGLIDGFERPLDGRKNGPVIPDYGLRRVQPLMANHGVGRHSRFFELCPPQPASGDERRRGAFDTGALDLYRATEIAFAHAGFLSMGRVAPGALGPWVPMDSMRESFVEYFLMRAIQQRFMTTPVRRIEYRHDGQFLDLARALRAGLDLSQAQLRIEYDHGLVVHVNRHSRQEWSVRWRDMTYTLPPTGWLVGEGQELLAYSALIAGNRADVVRSPEYRFLNVRSQLARRIEGITTDGAVALVHSPVSGRRDLFACGCKTVADSEELLRLSERADFSLIHRSEREVELCVLDSESGQSVTATVAQFSPLWGQTRLLLEEFEHGQWRRAPNQVQQTKRGLQLVRLRPDIVYRLTLPED